MITIDTYHQEPTLLKEIKEVRKTRSEVLKYQDEHTEITNEEDWKKYDFSTIFVYYGNNHFSCIGIAIYVDVVMGVWHKESYRQYVARTGDLS